MELVLESATQAVSGAPVRLVNGSWSGPPKVLRLVGVDGMAPDIS
jgi:hypothetical protein